MTDQYLQTARMHQAVGRGVSNSHLVRAKVNQFVGVLVIWTTLTAGTLAQNFSETSAPHSAQDFQKRAITRFARGDLNGALADYDSAIKLDPELATAYFHRGSLHRARGNKEQAFQDLNESIRLNPNLATAWYNRGTLLLEEENYDKALADFDQALKLDPKLASAWNNRGHLRLRLGDPQLALPDLNQAIKLNSHQPMSRYNRALAHHQLGRFELALQDLDRAIKLSNSGTVKNRFVIAINQNLADFYVLRGAVRKALGNTDKALENYNQALQINPEFAPALHCRGEI